MSNSKRHNDPWQETPEQHKIRAQRESEIKPRAKTWGKGDISHRQNRRIAKKSLRNFI